MAFGKALALPNTGQLFSTLKCCNISVLWDDSFRSPFMTAKCFHIKKFVLSEGFNKAMTTVMYNNIHMIVGYTSTLRVMALQSH